LNYPGTAVLFRRIEDGFSLEVRPWDSPEAVAWRADSEAADHVYRVGNVSTRVCGLL
jgi:hypothetical protein